MGIGRAIAKRYVRKGASVIVNDVDAELTQYAAETVNAAGGTTPA